MFELWSMRCTASLTSLQGLIRPGMEELERVLSMGQIELNGILMLN